MLKFLSLRGVWGKAIVKGVLNYIIPFFWGGRNRVEVSRTVALRFHLPLKRGIYVFEYTTRGFFASPAVCEPSSGSPLSYGCVRFSLKPLSFGEVLRERPLVNGVLNCMIPEKDVGALCRNT